MNFDSLKYIATINSINPNSLWMLCYVIQKDDFPKIKKSSSYIFIIIYNFILQIIYLHLNAL